MYQTFEDNSLEDLELTQMMIEDIIKQKKLDCISETVSKLNHFEKKVISTTFYIWYLYKKNSKERLGKSLTINLRINKIKEKIKTIMNSKTKLLLILIGYICNIPFSDYITKSRLFTPMGYGEALLYSFVVRVVKMELDKQNK